MNKCFGELGRFRPIGGDVKKIGGLEHGIRILVRTSFVHTVVKWYGERLGCLPPLLSTATAN